MKRKEEIEKLRQQLSDANADINQTNTALKTLAEINHRFKSLEKEYKNTPEPKLEDYYKESDEMKDYKILRFSIMGIGGGLILQKVFNLEICFKLFIKKHQGALGGFCLRKNIYK